jgi:hypothetical protein
MKAINDEYDREKRHSIAQSARPVMYCVHSDRSIYGPIAL